MQVLRFGCVRWVLLWVSVCLWVSALVCVRCACGAPCCAVCVAVWQVLPCAAVGVCAVVCACVLRCGGRVCFANKNKGLQCFLNEKDYMRLYLPINFLIISIMWLPLFDYIDNIMSIILVLLNFKKTPPSKSFGSSFLVRANYGNLNR
jgi:hypothetical protein